MRAKMSLTSITLFGGDQQELNLSAVGRYPYPEDGVDEDNTFARYTPSATIKVLVNNPDLAGKFEVGKLFYVDFTEIEETDCE